MIRINSHHVKNPDFDRNGIVWQSTGECSLHGRITTHFCPWPHDGSEEDPDVKVMRQGLTDAGVDASVSLNASGDIRIHVGPTETRTVDEIHGILERLYRLAS